MTNRRDFIQAGVALGALSSASAATWTGAPTVLSLHKVAFDSRLPSSAQFAAEARRRGASTLDTRGDVTTLWSEHLSPQWRDAPVALAGLTTYASLFALQTMAEDVRVRVIYRAHHFAAADGAMQHEQFGPQPWLQQQTPLSANASRWSRQAAQRIMQWPASLATVERARSNIAQAQHSALTHQTLVSWIIAPVQRPLQTALKAS